ncbi:hypothetical protein XA68_10010 [Ophiocordyceps unilateralis]|uniref:Uncharacterized protein n=1 Tax=Ophiocordyceps unilateralis TaxID=268505 RepID=A0A2A9PTD2_OPHUN|nr:hypothetical protein XA68_10010 [Ophiocordyceps unilateralis]
MDFFGEPSEHSTDYPIEISGQAVAKCRRLTQLALNSSSDMVIWAFSADGWAMTWAVETGNSEPFVRTAVLRDGSVRRVDDDGDVVMDDGDRSEGLFWHGSSAAPASALDGAAGNSPVETESSSSSSSSPSPSPGSYFEPRAPRRGERMSGTVSVDLVEEVSGIVRLDVELR